MEKQDITTISFDNRAPLRTRHEINSLWLGDGGAYSGIGYHRIKSVKCGQTIHVWTTYSSGCYYNNRCGSETIYRGTFQAGDYAGACAIALQALGDYAGYDCDDEPIGRPAWSAKASEAIADWDNLGWVTIPECCDNTAR